MVKLLLRYAQLVERNIVTSWEQLKNLVEHEGFPPGRLLSPNCRVWTETEIEDWFETRPVDLDPAARARKESSLAKARAKRKAASDSARQADNAPEGA